MSIKRGFIAPFLLYLNMAIVYIHKRADNGDVFYVGIGKTEKRAYQEKYRNQYWKNVAKKYGYTVCIIKSEIDWSEACCLEIELIAKYKRKIHGGTLCNITAGGDGVVGVKMSEEHKSKISKSNKGKKRSSETRASISKSRMGIVFSDNHKSNISKSKTGKKCSQEFKDKRSEATRLGNHPKAKIVVDLQTGIFYTSIKEACIRTCLIYTTEVQRSRKGAENARFAYA
jgi:hypothetical protein